MTLFDYVRLFRRGWLILLATTLLGIGAAGLLTKTATPSYSSTATVLVTTSSDGTLGGLQQGNDFSTQRARTYASMATTTAVLEGAAAETGDTVPTLRAATEASAEVNTAIIDVVTTGSSGEQAAARANAVAVALINRAVSIDGAGATSPLQLELLTKAEAPTNAITPRPRNNYLIGVVVGLALGAASLMVAHALDTRIRSIADLPKRPAFASATSLPAGSARGGKRARGGSTSDRRLEAFRNLRANLQFSSESGGAIAVAGVTSASDSPGLADQLSYVLGEIGMNVVVVDADLRERAGRRARTAGDVRAGLADVLSGTASLDGVLGKGLDDGVWTVAAGHVKESSAQQLSTEPMRLFLEMLTSRFDYVLVVCPPVVERSEASVVAALSHSALLVVESGVTTREEYLQARELLAGVGVEVPSVAIDGLRRRDLGASASDGAGARPLDGASAP